MDVAINNAAKVMNVPKPTNNQMSILRIFSGIVFVILALVALYYLYQYLYGEVTGSSFKLVNGPKEVKEGLDNHITFNPKQFAQITEGGEYSVSMWLYVNKWNSSSPKPILRIGPASFTKSDSGATSNFDTLVIYLDAIQNTLHVRTNSDNVDVNNKVALDGNALYNVSSKPTKCDVTNFELQRWVCVTVTLNNNTTDVYLDGKLARSCVSPTYFRVDGTTHQCVILENVAGSKAGTSTNGFAGYISNVMTYNYALNPDEVYRNYMAGPDASYTMLTYLLSLFNPAAYGEGVTNVKP